MSKEKLERMEATLKGKEQKQAEFQGERKGLLKQLADEGCKTIKAAESEVQKEERKAGKLQEEFDQKIDELETEFDWS